LRSGTIALQNIPQTHMRLYRLGTFNGNEEVEMAVRDLSGNAKATFIPQGHFSTHANLAQVSLVRSGLCW
jgi:hypothetical protein